MLRTSSPCHRQLRIASVARMQTSGCRFPGLCPIPDRIKGGVTQVTGAYGTAASLKVCAVAWLPEEDPLELLGIAQGVSWLPGWGSRVTTAGELTTSSGLATGRLLCYISKRHHGSLPVCGSSRDARRTRIGKHQCAAPVCFCILLKSHLPETSWVGDVVPLFF